MPQLPTSQQTSRGEKTTLIEQGTEFKGTMKSTCPVVVNGRIEGELTAPELDVTPTGTVRGNIKAERLSSRGVLSGNIDAGDLFLSGSVGSKTVIKAKNLEVKLAPDQGRMELTIGECTLDVGDEPSKERRSDPALKAGAPGSSTSQLPVTKSLPPASVAPPKEEASDPAASNAPPGSAKADAAEDPNKSRQSSSGFALSKPPLPPPPKKAGARDSVPPGAG
jgi:cytoskeletal protein CcmA (bactofilin family)